MTTATFNTARLTDSMERDMLRDALDAQNTLRPVAALKTAGHAVINTVRAIFEFANDVSNAMDDARSRSARFSGAQW